MEELRQFKQVLDKLPYLADVEKALVCGIFLAANATIRTEMVQFYQSQFQTRLDNLAEYRVKLQQARENFVAQLQTIQSRISA